MDRGSGAATIGLWRFGGLITVDELDERGSNVPISVMSKQSEFVFDRRPGVSRYRAMLGGPLALDGLLVNRENSVLLVSLHGALNRKVTELPRFERLATLTGLPFSSLFFADPTLWLSSDLELAWYVGTPESINPHEAISQAAATAAEFIGASHVIFTGSSGGGFAALQCSSYLPGSVAVCFNPQTRIRNYRVDGYGLGPQRRFLSLVCPESLSDGLEALSPDDDLQRELGERTSVLRRYAIPRANGVVLFQNVNDDHHYIDHYLPFREVRGDGTATTYVETVGPSGHVIPDAQEVRHGIELGIEASVALSGSGVNWPFLI